MSANFAAALTPRNLGIVAGTNGLDRESEIRDPQIRRWTIAATWRPSVTSRPLSRTLGSFSSFAAGFSHISILTGVFQMFHVGYDAGGPAFFWTWPAVFLGQLMVALCFAELAAQYPLSGGIYQWSRRPERSRRRLDDRLGLPVRLGNLAWPPSPWRLQVYPPSDLTGIPTGRRPVGEKSDNARNAVLSRLMLIAADHRRSTPPGSGSMARINNVGVIAELVGVSC